MSECDQTIKREKSIKSTGNIRKKDFKKTI